MVSKDIDVCMSLRALVTLGFLGNISFPIAGRFMVGLLLLKTHIEYFCLSDGVCHNACAVSTIEVSSDKPNPIINHYAFGQPTRSGLYSLLRDSPSYTPHKQAISQRPIMHKKKKKTFSNN